MNILLKSRLDLQIPRRKVCYQLDVAEGTLARWETGLAEPQLKHIPIFCRLYNLSYEQIIDGLTKEVASTLAETA